MLKKPASVVQTLNVPQRVRFGLSLVAALLDSLFEHPASMFASRIGSFTQKILIPLRTRRLPHRQRPTTDRSHKYNTPLARSVRLRGEFARKVKKTGAGAGPESSYVYCGGLGGVLGFPPLSAGPLTTPTPDLDSLECSSRRASALL